MFGATLSFQVTYSGARVRVPAALLALSVTLACGHPSATPEVSPVAGIGEELAVRGKSRVTASRQAMVVSGSPIASQVGRDILQQGGNAVDAAVAVGFALAVVHPEAGNIGGGGFMIIRPRDGKVQALDYREAAPALATRDMYRSAGEDGSVTGHLSAGVPGAVAGLTEAHRRYGRLPLAAVIQPAIRLAHEGFAVDEYRSRSIGEDSARPVLFPASRTTFLPADRPPQPGSTFRQPERGDAGGYSRQRGGRLLSRPGGRAAGGRDETGRWNHQPQGPGRLSGHLARSRRDHVPRLLHLFHAARFIGRGDDGISSEHHGGLQPLPPFGSAALMHREAEAMRRAFTDRNTYLGDPAFVHNPLDRLLSKQYAADLRRQIGERASPTPVFEPAPAAGSSTTHYSVVDAEGNAVSCTTTLNNSYGSAVTVTGAGFLLNDEMDDFATSPGEPNMYGLVQGEANAIAPGKRMLSAMTPSIVLDPGKQLYLVVGTPGGPRIITMVYHVISNVIDHRMSLPDAVMAPRMHHQGLPDSLMVESNGFPPQTLDSLRVRGHGVSEHGKWGDVEGIIRTAQGWEGVSDPRLGGGGAGY